MIFWEIENGFCGKPKKVETIFCFKIVKMVFFAILSPVLDGFVQLLSLCIGTVHVLRSAATPRKSWKCSDR